MKLFNWFLPRKSSENLRYLAKVSMYGVISRTWSLSKIRKGDKVWCLLDLLGRSEIFALRFKWRLHAARALFTPFCPRTSTQGEEGAAILKPHQFCSYQQTRHLYQRCRNNFRGYWKIGIQSQVGHLVSEVMLASSLKHTDSAVYRVSRKILGYLRYLIAKIMTRNHISIELYGICIIKLAHLDTSVKWIKIIILTNFCSTNRKCIRKLLLTNCRLSSRTLTFFYRYVQEGDHIVAFKLVIVKDLLLVSKTMVTKALFLFLISWESNAYFSLVLSVVSGNVKSAARSNKTPVLTI